MRRGTLGSRADYCGGQAVGGEAATGAPSFSQVNGELSMKKTILVGLAILAVSTSGALAKKASKPMAAPAAATTTGAASPMMMGQVSAADRELYAKSQRESGMKK
jgi:hypothetical protein